MRRTRTIILGILGRLTLVAFCLLAPSRGFVSACTIAVIDGSLTPDGRPLLWKNRDINPHRQEVRRFTDGEHGGYLALVTSDYQETTTAYMGVNDAGFAVVNAFADDLTTGSPTGHGAFMKRALRECRSVDDFETLLSATSGSRGRIWCSFGVIDALGGAAIFEADDHDYRRYDASAEGGFIARANNTLWGGGDMGGRCARANALIGDAAAVDQLDLRFILSEVARDMGEHPPLPCGQWPTLTPAINRHLTRASVAVHGVLPAEDPRLTTFWCTLGEPVCGVAVPLWSCAGETPQAVTSTEPAPPLNEAIRANELLCYDDHNYDTTINTVGLVGMDGLGGIHRYSFPIEEETLVAAAARLESWRQTPLDVESIALWQSLRAERTLEMFVNGFTPGEAPLPSAAAGRAEPRHNGVLLTWMDPPAPCFGVEIWRARWNDDAGNSVYPLYGNAPSGAQPTRPVDRHTALYDPVWVRVGIAEPGDETLLDIVAARGAYLYELFPHYGGADYGPPLGDGLTCVNYVLGDCEDEDGRVTSTDLTAFMAVWGLAVEDPGYRPEFDIAPTADLSPLGVPEPDAAIDFEDLMILMMNYDHSPTLPPSTPDPVVKLAWEPAGADTWALFLRETCVGLKGIRLRADLPSGSVTLGDGALIAEQTSVVFLDNRDSEGLDAGLAVAGSSTWLTGAGEVLQIRGGVRPGEISITCRDLDNRALEIAPMPDHEPLRLEANYPNPFNPMTRIDYFLGATARVKLEIFSISGRKVATLVNGAREAGRHTEMWEGCDDAGLRLSSGIYLYRLTAGDRTLTRRLCLIN